MVHRYIQNKISRDGAIHMTLIDPAELDPKRAAKVAAAAARAGTSAIMIGGSIGVGEELVNSIVKEIKNALKNNDKDIPVILFPGNPSALSPYADAVWFLSVLNSLNPYFIIGGQMQAAPLVKRYGLEPLPLAYLIIGEGGAVGYVSQTRPIPFNQREVAIAYALAAQYMGFRYVYLEGGSGGRPVPPALISAVKKEISVSLIVGGGIREADLAYRAAKAGADIIVTGNIIEEVEDVENALRSIVDAIKQGARQREK